MLAHNKLMRAYTHVYSCAHSLTHTHTHTVSHTHIHIHTHTHTHIHYKITITLTQVGHLVATISPIYIHRTHAMCT